jgi:flavin-dependent dehydrogenase
MGPSARLVVVIGAGPAGAVAAHTLALKGRAVLLVDAGRGSVDRIEMLPPAAIAAFEAAGFGRLFNDPSLASPCLGIVRGPHREDFMGRPGGRGLAVHRPTLDAALRSAAVAAGAELRVGHLVFAAATGEGIEMTVSAGSSRERLLAQTVIDASGRAAALARRLGGRISTIERLTAQRTAASPTIGPWLTFLPDPKGWSYAISGPEGRVDAWRVSDIPGREASTVDASTRVLEPAAGARWIAVGDASTAFDPICCQGLAHAAGTATVAAGMILDDGTISPEAAKVYDAACHETAKATEAARRLIYAGLRSSRRAKRRSWRYDRLIESGKYLHKPLMPSCEEC